MSPFIGGGGLSSFDLRFSRRGGRNAVGEVEGVLLLVLLPELLDDDCTDADEGPDIVVVVVPVDVEVVVAVVIATVVVVGVPVVDVAVAVVVRPPRPFAPPFRSLL